MNLLKAKKIWVAGHRGMVGSALVRAIKQKHPHITLLTPSREDVDVCERDPVRTFYKNEKPDIVIVAAAKVGGIHANNTYPAEFIQQNLAIALNTIHEAYLAKIPRLLFLGSSCIYPRGIAQPMAESALLTSSLEPTNEAYAIAKIAGLKMCQHYRSQYGVLYHSAMPTNLYGPGDNYHLENSHVLPALIRRFHTAKVSQSPSVTVWGSGTPRREFLHVDDLAVGILHILTLDTPPDWVNIGYGDDVTIRELAETVKSVVGYTGELFFDRTKPDGTPQKLLDIKLIQSSGWSPTIPLREGIANAYQDFLSGVYRQA